MFCGYFLYCWSISIFTIPIYYYELLIPLCLLSAKGIISFSRLFADRGSPWQRLVPVLSTISLIGAMFFFIPVRVLHLTHWQTANLRSLEAYVADQSDGMKALVFMELREPDFPPGYLPWPSPRLDDPMLFVLLRDDKTNEAAIRAFPDRTPFLMKRCDRHLRPQYVKKLPFEEPLKDPDMKDAVRTHHFRGKIDRSDPPPMTVFLLNLLGLREN